MIDKERFDSLEEWYFSWYLEELVEAGYVKDFTYPGRTFELYKGQKLPFYKVLKTKTKDITRELIRGVTYTPDFLVYWQPKAEGVLHLTWDYKISRPLDIRCAEVPFVAVPDRAENQNGVEILQSDYLITHVDIKPNIHPKFAARSSSLISFPIKQKWVMAKYHQFVQHVIAETLFKGTFTPDRYLRTDADRMDRTIKWEPKSIDQFLIEQKARRDDVQRAQGQTSIF